MGTEARIVIHAGTRARADSAASAAFARIAQLDSILSDYRVDSELSALAAAAGGEPIQVSDDLFRVLRVARDLARETGGAFDPTIGPLTVLWRDARRRGRIPDDTAIARATGLVGWSRVTMDPRTRTVRLHTPGIRLDLGAIAKGYAADEALAALRAHGAPRALVTFGGEIVAGGPPPDRTGWRITIADADSAYRVRDIANAAVSTSGDTQQFIEIGGSRYSHVIDPRTGMPLTDRLAATVFAKDGITADAYATAVTVLDSAGRAAFIARHGSATFYVRRVRE